MADPVLTVSGWIVGVGAALAVIGKAIRDIWAVAQRVHDMWELVDRELRVNGGTSIKDEIQLINLRINELEKLLLVHVDRRDPPIQEGFPV